MMRLKSWQGDLFLFVLASPILAIRAVTRGMQQVRFMRLATQPAVVCRTCGAQIVLYGFWRCRCGFTYQGHRFRTPFERSGAGTRGRGASWCHRQKPGPPSRCIRRRRGYATLCASRQSARAEDKSSQACPSKTRATPKAGKPATSSSLSPFHTK